MLIIAEPTKFCASYVVRESTPGEPCEHHDRCRIGPQLVGDESADQTQLYHAMYDKKHAGGNPRVNNRLGVMQEQVRYQIGRVLFQFSLDQIPDGPAYCRGR